ncbi:MAG: 3-keto-5-aminohexanoate cleavage protein [Candidatus Muirbacterium halophilum]|nr:3-keto-5-aminohexanoate cleavage protein [Candidatus Muirbacterium halophilum]MCK9475142.1 3-keto-5-aminohexanoate cleavage protein [Candidatus Muirbacterium halophilum]
MKKMIITCAVSGAETTKKHNPALPVTPEEIAVSTYEAYLAGASIVHLHVRDKNGNPTQDIEVFKKAIELIRQKCDIVIEVTTGGAVGMTPEERLQPVRLSPDMASLDCGTVNFGDEYIVNTLPIMREFAIEMEKYKVRPTLECFDLSHIYASHVLIKEGILKPPFHYGFVLNVPGGVPYSSENLNIFVSRLPLGSHFTVIGIGGRASLMAHFGAIDLGGFLRVGFEDNIYYSKGVLAKNNAELVERAVRISKEAGLEIAKPQDVRKLLKLKEG